MTSFVGRRRETAQAVRLVRRARLVTLTGVAGVGKTRLALRVAAQVREAFPDGVWLVELAALTEDKLLAPTLADVMGIQDRQGQRSAMDVLADYLEDKQLLLVLDNCEHLLDSCAVLAGELLRVAPGVRVLATSRQVLGVAGEYLLEVPPLSVPDPEQSMTTRSVARHEAVRLFTERAALARPGFAVDAHNRATIVRICRRLDGIPLAIELAALRVRALPVTEILAGLDDHLGFLAVGNRIAVPRLQALRATIDWSFALCSPLEQQLWARASVFAGGFDLQAAEAVCSGQGIAREDVFELVAALVDKSVLPRTRDDTDPVARYRMLEAIRQYGEEQLAASGQQTATRARHRDHYRWLVTWAEQEWLGPNEQAWFATLRREHPNVRATLEFCLTEPGQARAGLEITAALFHYWVRSGTHTEGRYWLDQALELDPEPSPQRAKALWTGSWLALLQADMATGLSLLEQGRALAHQLGDEPTLAHTTLGFGVAAFFQNDLDRAVPLLEDALAHHQTLDDPTGVWLALISLTLTTAALGNPDRAADFGEECLALCDSRGAYPSTTYPLWALSFAKWLSGDRQQATRLIRDGLPATQQFDDRWALAHNLETLAWITEADGRHTRAARLLGAAHTIWRTTGTLPCGPRFFVPFHDHCKHHIRAALGDDQFTAAFQHGTRFTPDQAIDYALEETSEQVIRPF
ncbi:non-specific serine/threonine protein kinase [Kibdelosporangium banguiense]|uniref:Non-specific serine/threonine protein kinase n=1 Tax=Kibdelosporangium banguiense TaxID=1365924 RepID=A0ABS4TW29_9PSEU|nr:AAA family ATPase [Kibdelosporangium banguiense]MBP2328611.1 non-specific serine/threonine protein kinase [Kibdelosporangium banguiense]